MKIPTLLGITILIALIISSGLYYFYFRKNPEPTVDVQVSDLQVVNISDSTATVIWQTSVPAIGKVLFSQSDAFDQEGSDNRDRGQASPRSVHFVTLQNLKSNTKYNFKIKNDSSLNEKASEFTTANIPNTSDQTTVFSFIKPLKGTILNTNLNPVDESLVYLKINGAQPLATFSSTAGNFIMPLKTVLNKDLNQVFMIPEDTAAEITVVKGTLKSEVKIRISEGTINLPPIPLGANLDLQRYQKEPMNLITFSNSGTVKNYDFNNDQKINSLDLAILREATNPKNAASIENTSKFDLNLDGIVDKGDVDLFSKKLTGN